MSCSKIEFEEALFLYESGLELVEREDWQEALSRFNRALNIFDRVGSNIEISLCLKALGKIYGYLGRWIKAIEYFERDLEIQKQMGNQQELMEDVDSLITYYTKSCNFEKAINQLQQMHGIFEKSEKHKEVVRVQSYLGQVYESMGDVEQALTHYIMAFNLGEKLDLPNTIKLETKICKLKSGKHHKKEITAKLDDMELPQFGVRSAGGARAESQAKNYADVLSDLDELSKKKILGEKDESKVDQEKIWIPSKEIPHEEPKLYLDIVYQQTLEANKEQVLKIVLGEKTNISELSNLTKEKIGDYTFEVLVLAPDFDIPKPRGKLEILPEKESKALTFRLTPRMMGRHQISLEFYHLGKLLLKRVANIFVKEEPEEVCKTRDRVELSLCTDWELDATLRIHRIKNRFYFHLFTKHADDFASETSVHGVSELDQITSERLQLQMRNFTYDGEHPQRAMTILSEIGRKVYSLIPKGVREGISLLNPRYLIIETEDLFVPFELAFDGEEYLCLKYCLGKRILNEERNFEVPPNRIGDEKLRTKLIIAQPEREMIISEKEFLKSVEASGLLILDEVGEKVDKKNLTDLLSQGGDIVHIRCRGVFDEKEPAESKLLLSDGILQLKDIEKLNITNKPLIFADIREESMDWKEPGIRRFVGIAALAKAFLGGGASAFIGSSLQIPDHLVSEIMIKFYEKIIVNGKQLGIIMREIKKELKQKYPGVLWAAFNLYGDPTLKLALKKQ